MIYKISYMVAHKLITKSCDMKKLLLLFFLSVCSVPIFAQTTQELLMSTNWEPQGFFDEGECGYVKFTTTQFVYAESVDNQIDYMYNSYYLSFIPLILCKSAACSSHAVNDYVSAVSGRNQFR